MCYTILYAVFYGTFLKSCTWLESTQQRTQTLATFVASKQCDNKCNDDNDDNNAMMIINAIIIILLLG